MRNNTGFVECLLDKDPLLNNHPGEYNYSLSQPLLDGDVGVAIGVVGMEVNSHGHLDFGIESLPIEELSTLRFRVIANDSENGWRMLRFNFFASQSSLFSVGSETATQFSFGPNSTQFSVYRPLPNSSSPTSSPTLKLFLCGVTL
jgi:hypothetical protein